MRRAALGFLLAFGAATPALAAEVVALGASNTEGKGRGSTPDGVPRAQAYPAQLQQLLATRGCHIQVANAGAAGDTTAGMLRRVSGAIGLDTKVLIIQPGGNDARQGEGGNTTDNVEAMRRLAAQRRIEVLILDQLNRLAPQHRLPDGQHFSAEGHAVFAAFLAPKVLSSAACRG
jgi:acyl-CoA thioesterase I